MRQFARALVLVVSFSLSACGGEQLLVSPYEPGQALRSDECVYYLPRTDFRVEFQLLRTHHVPGPYSAFAEELLGIILPDDLVGDTYRLASVGLATELRPDVEAPFVARFPPETPIGFLALDADGRLLPLSPVSSGLIQPAGWGESHGRASSPLQPVREGPEFTTLSHKPLVEEVRHTIYSVVQVDTSFVRTPVYRSHVVSHTKRESAQEVANLIFTLRQKRVDLVSMDMEPPADGQVLRQMLAEMDRLESQYLGLFLGFSTVDTLSQSLTMTPAYMLDSSGRALPQRAMVASFSRRSGLTAPDELEGDGVVLTVYPGGMPSRPHLPPLRGAYYYRQPERVRVTLELGGRILLDTHLPVMQFGRTVHLPARCEPQPLP